MCHQYYNLVSLASDTLRGDKSWYLFSLDPMFTIEQAGAWKSICRAQFTVLAQT